MNIYVLTEIYKRECPQLSLLLRSLSLSQSQSVCFVDQSVFNERFKYLPVSDSAILIKDLQAIRRRNVRAYKKYSNKVFVYDIESLLIFGVDRFLATRLDQELLSIIDIYFVPTKYLLDILVQRFPRFAQKFVLAASPKVKSSTFDSRDSPLSIKSTVSNIYVVSNFATLYPRTESQNSIDNFLLAYSSPSQSTMQLVKQTNDLYNSYLQYSADMLRSIFLDYSSLSFFYRPHPFENINSPRHFLSAQFPNVVILDNKQSFYTQSITCDLVISSMSTVSIELASSTPVPILELSPSSDFFSFVEPPLTHFLCDQVISSIRSFDLFMSNLPNHEIVHLNLFEQQVACKPSVWEGLFSALNFKYTKSSGYGSILFRLSLIPFAFLAIARSLIAQLLIVKISFLSALHYNPASKNPILYLFFGLSASSSQP